MTLNLLLAYNYTIYLNVDLQCPQLNFIVEESMPLNSWMNEEKRRQEWQYVKLLVEQNNLLINGTLIDHKQYCNHLTHSFVVIDNQLLAMDEKYDYGLSSGQTLYRAENEEGISYTLHSCIIKSYLEKELRIISDLGLLEKGVLKVSAITKVADIYMLARRYYCSNLVDFLDNQADLSLDLLYELSIKICLLLFELHNGRLSKSKQAYYLGKIDVSSLRIDEQNNLHFVNFANGGALKNQWDLSKDLQELFAYFYPKSSARDRRDFWLFEKVFEAPTIRYRIPTEALILKSENTLFIYVDPSDPHEGKSYAKIRYALLDREKKCQYDAIELASIGMDNVILTESPYYDLQVSSKVGLEREVEKHAFAKGYRQDPAQRNPFLLALFANPENFSHLSGLDLAEIITACRLKLENEHFLLKEGSLDERLHRLEIFLDIDAELKKAQTLPSSQYRLIVENTLAELTSYSLNTETLLQEETESTLMKIIEKISRLKAEYLAKKAEVIYANDTTSTPNNSFGESADSSDNSATSLVLEEFAEETQSEQDEIHFTANDSQIDIKPIEGIKSLSIKESNALMLLNIEYQKLQQTKKGCFCFFNTNINENWSLSDYVLDAQKNNSLTRKAFINLKWMDKKGKLTDNIPSDVSECFLDVVTSREESIYYKRSDRKKSF